MVGTPADNMNTVKMNFNMTEFVADYLADQMVNVLQDDLTTPSKEWKQWREYLNMIDSCDCGSELRRWAKDLADYERSELEGQPLNHLNWDTIQDKVRAKVLAGLGVRRGSRRIFVPPKVWAEGVFCVKTAEDVYLLMSHRHGRVKRYTHRPDSFYE